MSFSDEPARHIRVLIVEDHPDMVLAGNVECSDDREFTPVDTRIEMNGADFAARNGAAHGSAVPHAFKFEIVKILRAPEQFVHALFAGDRSANDACCRGRTHRGEACGGRTDLCT